MSFSSFRSAAELPDPPDTWDATCQIPEDDRGAMPPQPEWEQDAAAAAEADAREEREAVEALCATAEHLLATHDRGAPLREIFEAIARTRAALARVRETQR